MSNKDSGISPAALRALFEGDLDNFIVASTPGGIEAQEKQGQMDLVRSSKLPLDIKGKSREELESIGFVFGEPIDDLFQNVQLPQGWKVEATDHSMWSDILDEAGKKRGSVFYKAAFYDRRAFANIDDPSTGKEIRRCRQICIFMFLRALQRMICRSS